LFLNVANSTRG